MEKINLAELLYRMIAIMALTLIAIVIGFGWLKGYLWERDIRRRQHRH